MKKLALYCIQFYRRCVSPHFLPRCRFNPTCSTYAKEAVETHGIFVGAFLAFFRILRCNPFSKGGIDFVPEKGFIHKFW